MIAFRLSINGRHVATAGLPGSHVVSAILSSVVRTKRALRKIRSRGQVAKEREIDLALGGLISREDGSGEHVHWATAKLEPGDTVTIEVLRTRSVDAPRRRRGRLPEGRAPRRRP